MPSSDGAPTDAAGVHGSATARHAASPCAAEHADPPHDLDRGPGERFREPGGEHPGVDRPGDRRLHRHPSEDRQVEDLADLARDRGSDRARRRATTPGGALERRCVHGPAQREVAPAQHDDDDVGDLDDRPDARARRRAAVDEHRRGSVSEGDAERGAGLGRREHGRRAGPPRPRGSSATPGATSVSRRSSASVGASTPASSQSARPTSGSAPRPNMAGRSPDRSATRTPEACPVSRASRARTSADAAVKTDVPDPPVADQRAMSNGGNLPPGGARAPATGGSCTGKRRQRTTRVARSQGPMRATGTSGRDPAARRISRSPCRSRPRPRPPRLHPCPSGRCCATRWASGVCTSGTSP